MHDPLNFAPERPQRGADLTGIIARLEESRRLLDELGHPLAAAYVDMAVHVLHGEVGPERCPDPEV